VPILYRTINAKIAESLNTVIQNDALSALSERIRTMSFGILVFVWGLFTGGSSPKPGSPTPPGPILSPHVKIALLAIATSAVIVLALDLAEYASTYQSSRQRVGETVVPDVNYECTRRIALLGKQLLGFATLIAFIVVLGSILVSTAVSADDQDHELAKYYGRWCIGNRDTGQSTVLVISKKEGKNYVEYNQEFCTPPIVREGYIRFDCGSSSFAAVRDAGLLTVSRWKGEWFTGNHDTKNFYDCRH
jgi:hypothetical protein